MSSAAILQVRSRHGGLSLEEALKKLREACRTIESREGVKKHEQTRINDALHLVTTSSAPSSSKTAERRGSYQHFLRRVEKLCGLEIVALCAVGLGKTAIAGMRESVRLEFPSSIKLIENTLKCSPLRELVHERPAEDDMASTMVESRGTPSESETPSEPEASSELEPSYEAETQAIAAMPPTQQIGSFAGRVFRLTQEDAINILMTDQVAGGIWLTDPYIGTSFPFITIPITQQLTRQYAMKRPRAV